ncbi:MAG: DNA-directed RNA polymerase subunit beta [Lachnospiraceae bacterium]|nr:DNA-directed RNA polymerase subunit beta [Lachnospiraceae bacterium]
MKKSRINLIKAGKDVRMSYARKKEILDMPNLIEVQRDSYQWFLDEGLMEAFNDVMPIEDRSGDFSLSYQSHRFCYDEIKYNIEQCKEYGVTYAVPLKVKLALRNMKEESDEIIENEIFMGDLPLMTETGTFVVNGAERVIVSQLVRSPGVYYTLDRDKFGKRLFNSQVIPNRGAWLEYETDTNDVFYVRVDRNRKVPVTVLIRALGVGTDAEIKELFGEDRKILATLEKDISTDQRTGLEELYKKIKPGDPFSEDNAYNLITGMYLDDGKYDLAKVGRFKFNKKLSLRNRAIGRVLSQDVVDPSTGEVIYAAGTTLTKEVCDDIQYKAVEYIFVEVNVTPGMGDNFPSEVKILSNMMVDITEWTPFSKEDAIALGITEEVYYPELKNILEQAGGNETELKKLITRNITKLIPRHITLEDIFVSINYNITVQYGIGNFDDIDHLGNRRIRAVGELLQNQYRLGLSRLERGVREKMQTMDEENISIQSLINIKPVTGVIKEFFGSSQLSQFMDQNNPLAELTHKRRLSALGPGGLSRDRAGFEVRDVHYTHYGRMCPIETPEGPNIGLINSLATYARINEYGFVEAPYFKCDKSDPKNPRVTDEAIYLTADEEDNYHVAQANAKLDENGYFVNDNVAGRYKEETAEFSKELIDLMDVSPRMVFSVATSMIPFLQNDDANRALMGSNMQRQAVPLLITEAPVVGTGMEEKAAVDSGICILAKRDGVVEISSSTEIVVRPDDATKEKDVYHLTKFARSNQSNCVNQRPIVFKGDKVKKGQVIADGASTDHGEIALGKNPLIGFMTWEGYNYEDAVLMSERMVQDDVYTSVHIEKYVAEARDTKLGPEEITKDLAGLGEDVLKDLDENGVIRVGAEVRAGDILVGKVTPKGETELTPEERLLRAIFGEKAREVRDTSLRVPHGAYGVIMSTQTFTRENKDELSPGVNKSVNVYIAQKRKISVGDKMAGRHGNKGVISRILPVEDMPFLPNGRPLDIVLNPLGVPSRMNIGQVLEIHLSLAAKVLGINVSTPIFNGANEVDIMETLELANDYANEEWDVFEERWGDKVDDGVMEYLSEHRDHREEWKGVPINRTGKVQLRDGRTGEEFDNPVTIGFMHYLKLHHLVDDKIHARSTGPYSLVTQQPLGGKAQFGGQRFGEMEVWALEGYGAAYTLQEILTVKSDDVVGRVKTYESIIKGENIQEPGVPESFRVLLKEFQSLALDINVLDENGEVIKIQENVDYSTRNPEMVSMISESNARTPDKESEYKSSNSFGEVTVSKDGDIYESEDFDEVMDDVEDFEDIDE